MNINMNRKFLEVEQVLRESGWSKDRNVGDFVLENSLVLCWPSGGCHYANPTAISVLRRFLGLRISARDANKELFFIPIDFSLDYVIHSYDLPSWLTYQWMLKDYLYPVAYQEGGGTEITIATGINGYIYGICGISGYFYRLGDDIFTALDLLINNKELEVIPVNELGAEKRYTQLIFDVVKNQK